MIYFVDTSALAKRYIPEVGSNWVLSWILPAFEHTIVVSDLASIEIFSLLRRRHLEGALTASRLSALDARFLLHMEQQYAVIAIDDLVINSARELIRRNNLRALDAIQLACAVRASMLLKSDLSFISADRVLLAAASAEGFAIDNPLDHV